MTTHAHRAHDRHEPEGVGMAYAPQIGPMREGESRYRDLPTLALCSRCKEPMEYLAAMTVVHKGRAIREVCPSCALVLTDPRATARNPELDEEQR